MIGDSRHLPLKDGSVNCIITSPPYWSLRKYDIPDLIWDSVEGCEHEWINKTIIRRTPGDRPSESSCVAKHRPNDTVNRPDFEQSICVKCSAWRGQLGLEPTIDLYLKHLMQIMDECKRVLRDDGTMWVNLGDSYSGSGKAGNNPEYQERHTEFGKPSTHRQRFGIPTNSCDIPTKSLCLIPYRFAIKMVDRGWILRNVIIWHKPNSMPSSVKDRFSVDFEYVFFFVKSRKYWFEQQYDGYAESTLSDKRDPLDAPRKERGYPGQPQHGGHLLCDSKKGPGRNRRCVWTIPTQPYPESHFATFPEALIEPMIKAGCPKEICIKCGKAREAVYEGTSKEAFNIRVRDVKEGRIKHTDRVASQEEIENYKEGVTHAGEGKKLKGYTDCGCNAGFRPGIILDPFCGSGTTMRVAEKLNRVGIGFDLAYGDLQDKRMRLIQKQLL